MSVSTHTPRHRRPDPRHSGTGSARPLGLGRTSEAGRRRSRARRLPQAARGQHSGKVLGVDGMSTANSAQVVQFDDNGTADHLWRFL